VAAASASKPSTALRWVSSVIAMLVTYASALTAPLPSAEVVGMDGRPS